MSHPVLVSKSELVDCKGKVITIAQQGMEKEKNGNCEEMLVLIHRGYSDSDSANEDKGVTLPMRGNLKRTRMVDLELR